MKKFLNKLCRSTVVLLLMVGMMSVTIVPAFGATTIHEYHFNPRYRWPLIGGANGFELEAYAQTKANWWNSYGYKFQPAVIDINNPSVSGSNDWTPNGYTSHPPYAGAQWAGTTKYVGSLTDFMFNVKFRVSGLKYNRTYARYRFRKNTTYFVWWGLGFKTNSPPQLDNPATLPDGEGGESTNTQDMVVTNLEFAQSPLPIPNASCTLDNPEVQQLFLDSSDTVRPGPIVVAPGEESSVSPAMDASILDPEPGGRTILAKGEALDASGTPMPFLMQFIAENDPAPVPSSSWWSVLMLFMVAIAFIFSRQRLQARFESRNRS